MEEKKILEDYNNFIHHIRGTFEIYFKYNHDMLNNYDSTELNFKMNLAIKEIETLLLVGKSNTPLIVKKVNDECLKIIEEFKKVEEESIKDTSDYKGILNDRKVIFNEFFDRFKLLIGEENVNSSKGNSSLVKIKWLGNQKQLAELFITLEKLNWFEPLQDGERKSIARNICNLFDISLTQKNPNTDFVNSFAEIMKPDTDTKTNIKTYPKVFAKRYKVNFSEIRKRE